MGDLFEGQDAGAWGVLCAGPESIAAVDRGLMSALTSGSDQVQNLGGRGPASFPCFGIPFWDPKFRLGVTWATVKGHGPAGPVRRENVDCDWPWVPGGLRRNTAAPEHGCAGHQAGRPVPGAVPGPVGV